jgi:formylmethanofuran dehydrogenase subunit C
MPVFEIRDEADLIPVELTDFHPPALLGLGVTDLERLPARRGNRAVSLGDLFRIRATESPEVVVSGSARAFKRIGAGMSSGRLIVEGSAGMHVGAGMSGGELVVRGDADTHAGAELSGGLLRIEGSAGDQLGAPYPGSRFGMTGGMIVVGGSCGQDAGGWMRRGVIAVAGGTGPYPGVGMGAGTLVIGGRPGPRLAPGLVRGSLLLLDPATEPESLDLLPTFRASGSFDSVWVTLLSRRLASLGFEPALNLPPAPRCRRWVGDFNELGRGEILLRTPSGLGAS